MGSSRKGSGQNHWFPKVLLELMAEKKWSSRRLAEHIDRPESLVQSVLDGTHTPSIILCDQLLHGLGYELEIMPRKSNG
jgi:ribosome-binding protein aMBF1 (putative translation factor)